MRNRLTDQRVHQLLQEQEVNEDQNSEKEEEEDQVKYVGAKQIENIIKALKKWKALQPDKITNITLKNLSQQ